MAKKMDSISTKLFGKTTEELATKDNAVKLAGVTAGAYIAYQALSYAWWKYKNAETKAKGRRVREARDKKTYEFPKVPQEHEILSLDVAGLRQGLLENRF